MPQYDLNTLNGSLMNLGETLANNLVAKGVSASASDGLTTLVNKVLDIQTTTNCYFIRFSQDAYTAFGGSVTLECTLQENYALKTGATVTLSDGTSQYSSITDSNGVATFNLTGLSTSATFTCSYSNVSDSCFVTVSQYLFYDACSPSYVSENYGTIIPVSSSTTTNLTAYDSTNNCYKTRANGDWGIIPITALTNADNYKIEAYFKRPNSNAVSQGGFSFANPLDPSNNFFVRMRGDGKIDYGTQPSQTTLASSLGNAWIRIELTVQGQNIGIKAYDGDTLKGSTTTTNPISNSVIGLHLIGGSNYGFYVKEIKAESI